MSMNRSISRVLAAAVASAGFAVPIPTIGGSLSCTAASFSANPDGNGNINISCTQPGTTTGGGTVPPPDTGGGTTPPPGGPISCAGFAETIVLDLPWGSPGSGGVRAITKGFGNNDIVVARFTTPSTTAANVFASIAAAEYVDQQHQRTAALSRTPCDFPYPNPLGRLATTTQASSSLAFTYAIGGSSTYYAILQSNTTYYLNIKNVAAGVSTCGPGQSCNMAIELQKPNGL